MSKLLSKMQMDMELRGFSPKTVTVYLKGVKKISGFHNIAPENLNYDHVREFLHDAITSRKLSRSYVNSNYSAIKFFFETTLGREWNMVDIPKVKQPSKLPITLTPAQIHALFDSVTNLKHKTMLVVCYSSGLRVGELMNLKVSDIHSDTMRIRVKNGKGLKERYTLLSKSALDLLRIYYKQYYPKDYLFQSFSKDKPLTTRNIQMVFRTKCDLLGFPKEATIHSLRHSFQAHLLLAGTNVVVIQKLLGHSKLSTTTVYLHLTTADVTKAISPFDSLEVFNA
ncbi:site-specific integrase [Fusibacter sp. 3D3]|uniref:tyrosine-type recombinase/integrase n=1 Tax=Fusibacter sp. 3D3 TaxID=1048380 RepID=UPI000853585C|nr:site-specific integrase [Fusibacter sp. 3D3]GAU78426.1 mobile element protein [Fusibacter sp. 3D3]